MIARPTLLAALLAPTLLLGGCDLEALLADPKAVQKVADAKAIGGACRHGNRSIEDCYALNEKFPKASIYDGWREMDQYMRENKLEGVEPKGLKPGPKEEQIIEEKASDEVPAPTKAPAKSKATDKAAH